MKDLLLLFSFQKMIKTRAVLLAVLLTLPICLFGSAPINISNSPSTQSTFPRITVDPDGYIHVVWAEFYSSSGGNLFYCRGEPGGTGWSEPLKISTTNVTKDSCEIDSDGSGRLYGAWIDNNSIKLRVFSGGQWNSPVTIASGRGDFYHLRLAVSSPGDIYAVWWTTSKRRVYSRARVGGNWESIKQISSDKPSKITDIAVGSSLVYACWMQKEYRWEIAYSKRNTGLNSSWSSVKKVYVNNLTQVGPAVEVNSNDIPHIIWGSEFNNHKVLHYSYWIGSGFSSPEEISSTRVMHSPSLAERNSDLFACWQVGAYANGAAIMYNIRRNGQWLGESGAPDSKGSIVPDVAASPDGENVYLVWDAYDDIYFYSTSETHQETNEPPKARFSFSPRTGIFPLAVSFDASESYDPDGTIVEYKWDFGDGGVGSGKKINYIYQSWGTFPITLLVEDNRGAEAREVKVIEVLRLFQPINIMWETFVDDSLFSSRYITEIYWEENHENDGIAEIVFYRIYKKRPGEANFAYRCIGEVTADMFTFRDEDVEETGMYVYTVTSVDGEGHESPIVEGTGHVEQHSKSDKKIFR